MKIRRFKYLFALFIIFLFVIMDHVAVVKLIHPWLRSKEINRVCHPYHRHGLETNLFHKDFWGDREYYIATDNLGCKSTRGKHTNKTADKRRVLFLGDSFVEGIGVDHHNTFVGILDDHYPDVECINGGIADYSPRLSYLRARFLLVEKGINVDQVVVYVGPDDPVDELLFCPYVPVLPFRERGSLYHAWRKIRNRMISNSYISFQLNKLYKRQLQGKFRLTKWGDPWEAILAIDDIEEDGSGEQHSTFEHFPQNLICNRENYEVILNDEEEANSLSWIYDDDDFQSWGKAGLEMAYRNVKNLYDLCQDLNIELSLAIYDWPYTILRSGQDPNRYTRLWTAFADSLNINLIDHGMDFDERSLDECFIQNDNHWTEKGHQRIADRIIEEGILN